MKDEWRFIDTGFRTAAENMALDEVILEAKSREQTLNTIRFLWFKPPAVLVGFHQAVEHEVRIEYCRDKGIDINRRITGGGAIFLNEKQLGWEIFAKKSDLRFPKRREELYRYICKAVIKGLEKLGVKASFRPKNDIEVNGRKISGTGGTERGDAFMFQGTLLLDFDVETMLKALRIPVKKLSDKEVRSVKDRVTTVKQELGYIPQLSKVKKAIREGFEEVFNISLKESGLAPIEKKAFIEKLPKFKSKEWVFKIRRPPDESKEIYAMHKTRGGLIKIALTIDTKLNIVKNALILGDFFAYPQHAIYDLEALLRNVKAEKESIKDVIERFFEESKAEILNVDVQGLLRVFMEAIDKAKSRELGFTVEETNHIFLVNTRLKDFMRRGCDVMLLPYCAKSIECRFRKANDCSMCGRCTVGEAYEIALKYGLKPITILNYEHLEETLGKLEEEKIRGYIGCCCEAFYSKHQNDFEKFKVPGVLVDIDQTSCYELNKEEEAYKGNFENQTSLRINMLKKILKISCSTRN